MARLAASTAHQLKITLQGSKPPIWRRVQVPSDDTLARLHYVIQESMGWLNGHLHQFEIGGKTYSDPNFELDDWEPVKNEYKTILGSVLRRKGDKGVYWYDFGDDWRHAIEVEDIVPAEPNVTYPRCIKAVRACPPEDVGGIWGFYEFVEALKDPTHPEHANMKEWVEGDFDPLDVDLDAINAVLARLNKNPKPLW